MKGLEIMKMNEVCIYVCVSVYVCVCVYLRSLLVVPLAYLLIIK